MDDLKIGDNVELHWIDACYPMPPQRLTTTEDGLEPGKQDHNWMGIDQLTEQCSNPLVIKSTGKFICRGDYYTAIALSFCDDPDSDPGVTSPMLIPTNVIQKIIRL